MPPEQPPSLVILDVPDAQRPSEGQVEYVDPEHHKTLRVRWGVGLPPHGYQPKAGGVVFVANASSELRPIDVAPNILVSGDTFSFSEGFNGADWLMLVLVLPVGCGLFDPQPVPAGSRIFGNRLAVYWRLTRESPRVAASVSWRLQQESNLASALSTVARSATPTFDPGEEHPKYKVFLSYRRTDDRWAAGRIHTGLTRRLGRGAVFRDVHNIGLGANFRDEIDKAVGQCRVLLAVIGPYWLDPGRPIGERRIDSINDWPRIEIESALQRHKLVIPVLLDDVRLTQGCPLPDSLTELPYCHGASIREETFTKDLSTLVQQLKPTLT